jgi:hypothetical protein
MITTNSETMISAQDPSSSPLQSSRPAVTEEAEETIFNISASPSNSGCSSDNNDSVEVNEEHQVDGTYAKSTIR